MIGDAPDRRAACAATEVLWNRRSSTASGVPYVSAMSGAEHSLVLDSALLSLVGSTETERLLDDLDFLTRAMTTTVEKHNERCIHSVRGPIQWGETITARANALGNEDVYVCSTASRSFNTVENRFLVVALATISRTAGALAGAAAADLDRETVALVEERSSRARGWLDVPRLKRIPRGRITARELGQLQRSRRLARMQSLVAFRTRQFHAFDAESVRRLCDPATMEFHRFAVDMLERLSTYDRIPLSLSCFDGTISSGRFSFRHPRSSGNTVPGVAFRGIPLLPPKHVTDGASWAGELPAQGIRINSEADVERLASHLGLASRRRR